MTMYVPNEKDLRTHVVQMTEAFMDFVAANGCMTTEIYGYCNLIKTGIKNPREGELVVTAPTKLDLLISLQVMTEAIQSTAALWLNKEKPANLSGFESATIVTVEKNSILSPEERQIAAGSKNSNHPKDPLP